MFNANWQLSKWSSLDYLKKTKTCSGTHSILTESLISSLTLWCASSATAFLGYSHGELKPSLFKTKMRNFYKLKKNPSSILRPPRSLQPSGESFKSSNPEILLSFIFWAPFWLRIRVKQLNADSYGTGSWTEITATGLVWLLCYFATDWFHASLTA